jgi:hypothetical protein
VSHDASRATAIPGASGSAARRRFPSGEGPSRILPPCRLRRGTAPVPSRYPWLVLGVLVVVYVFNFLDRQILSFLAERIKADLGLKDAQIGFLYGTAFAVFYALLGIPLGRLADARVIAGS